MCYHVLEYARWTSAKRSTYHTNRHFQLHLIITEEKKKIDAQVEIHRKHSSLQRLTVNPMASELEKALSLEWGPYCPCLHLPHTKPERLLP